MAGVGGRARSWDLTGSRDTGAPTTARPWVRTTPQPGPLQAALPSMSQPFLDSLTPEQRLSPHLQGSEGKNNLPPTEHLPESKRGPGSTVISTLSLSPRSARAKGLRQEYHQTCQEATGPESDQGPLLISFLRNI